MTLDELEGGSSSGMHPFVNASDRQRYVTDVAMKILCGTKFSGDVEDHIEASFRVAESFVQHAEGQWKERVK